jgi:uncharacterized membrane protein
MTRKKYTQLHIIVFIFIVAIVGIAIIRNSYVMATIGLLTGLVFMGLVHSNTKIKIDEREATIQEKAARMTYAIFAPTLGIGAFLMLIPSSGLFSFFPRGEFAYLESLGMVFAYLTLFLIAIYAITYYFLNKKYGGGDHEE